MLRSIITVLAIVFLFPGISNSQEIPPIKDFSPKDYMAGDQNWSISQDIDRNIYVANNKGLLEYNGAKWTLYQSPNQAIVRSVEVIDNQIYTGSYMDFGFWDRNSFGELKYTSLSNNLKSPLVEDEEFWKIIASQEFILFQSLDRIYIYNSLNEDMSVVDIGIGIKKSFKVDETIYFQAATFDIYKIQNGNAELFLESQEINYYEIVNVFERNDNFLIQSKSNGFFIYTNDEFKQWDISSNDLLNTVSVYNSIQLRNGNFILGTISNGVIKLNSQGEVLFTINKRSGLHNNTVLAAFQDQSGNIWLGLDNGISVLNLNSPFKIFKDGNGKLGTVYASVKKGDYLYLGTNQGLFYKSLNSQGEFKLIPDTEGQVWFLDTIGEIIFCGHDRGSFMVLEDRVKPITEINGVWNIKPVVDSPNLLIQGNYDGLSILKKTSGTDWVFSHKIKGFDISSRYFEFINSRDILVSHEYKGVYKLTLNDRLDEVIKVNKITENKGIGSGMINYNGHIYYAFEDGIYKYNRDTKSFDQSPLFQDYFTSNAYVSGKLISDNTGNRLWAFLNNNLLYSAPGKLSAVPIIRSVDLPSDLRESKAGFENIIAVDIDQYLLGTSDGYIIINLEEQRSNDLQVRINSANYSSLQQNSNPIDLNSELYLKSNQNDVYFDFSLPNYEKLRPSQYQYKLIGIYDNWSDWSSDSDVLFENLPHGDYEFNVRGKVGSEIFENIQSFKFSIEKPWYIKPLAIAFYVILFLMLLGLIQYLNRRYYKNQEEKLLITKEKEFEIRELENERQIMKFKNQTLQQDIESKNRELGISTMNLIRKNEFLNNIKIELDKVKELKDLNRVVTIIDKNINNTEDWKFFEEAFNNADKDFLKKIKNLHPSLTPNDLKLCAYLRLNLSSKEIAPLLNISHRSVEVKRYRLRKKMDLPREESLTNYIIQI